jgi:hypothetical protein
MSARARCGFTLAETLVALLLGFLLIHLGLDALSRLRSARERMASRADALVAVRVSAHVMRRELNQGIEGLDWRLDADSIGMRAFRGTAVVCGADPSWTRLLVAFTGDRMPDPTKDSLLLLTPEGGREARALESIAPPTAPCLGPEGSQPATWLLDAGAPAPTVVARLFERGSYHLSGSALRYRRGAGGRQPLTPEVWSSETRWTRSAGWVGIELLPSDARAGRGWSGPLAPSGLP